MNIKKYFIKKIFPLIILFFLLFSLFSFFAVKKVEAVNPTFGLKTGYTNVAGIGNYIRYMTATNCLYSGAVKTITAYISTNGVWGTIKCALYSWVSNTNVGNLLATCAARSINDAPWTWETFTFNTSYNVVAGTKYVIVIWANVSTCVVGYTTGGNGGYVSLAYAGWPSPITSEVNQNRNFSMYVTYSIPPTQSSPAPTNSSIGNTLTPRCNITVNDPDGDSMTVNWYENSTGSWVHRQKNSSCANGTYRWTYAQATEYNTKYYWKVTLYDGINNISAWYCFTTLVPLIFITDIVNASGTYDYVFNATTGIYTIYLNYTGTPSSLVTYNHTAFSSHIIQKLFVTASNQWRVWVNSTGTPSTLVTYNNTRNVTRSIQRFFASGLNQWRLYDNSSGNTTPLTHYENIVNAGGSFTHILDGTGIRTYANYTGTPSSITTYNNSVNATHIIQKLFVPGSNLWKIWVNSTGYSHAITQYNDSHNVSGTQQKIYSPVTGWRYYTNMSGDLTPFVQYNNTDNVTGATTVLLDGNGYRIFSNLSGNITPIELLESLLRVTGSHSYVLNSSGYHVTAAYTGNQTGLVAVENIVNASGTHEYSYRPALGVNGEWWVWANYTGSGSAPLGITLFEHIVNATGHHSYSVNATNYTVWANYTGTGNGSNITIVVGSGHRNYYLLAVGLLSGMILVGVVWNPFKKKKQ